MRFFAMPSERAVTDMQFEVKISATAEVRDKDGNLKSSEPVESTITMSEAELRAFIEGSGGSG